MPGFQQLTIEERIQLVEDIWDSIAIDADQLPVTDAQKRELDRRIERYRTEGPDGIPVEDVVAEIRRRL